MYKTAAVAMATVLTLLGCQTRPQQDELYPQLLIGPKAQGYLQIEGVQQGVASSDLLRAGVRLHNRSRTEQILRYRFSWFDARGFELQGLAARWERQVLRPNEPVTLDRVAPGPNAVSYRIQLFDVQSPTASTTQGIDG